MLGTQLTLHWALETEGDRERSIQEEGKERKVKQEFHKERGEKERREGRREGEGGREGGRTHASRKDHYTSMSMSLIVVEKNGVF